MVDASGLKLLMYGFVFVAASMWFVHYVGRVGRKYFGASQHQINIMKIVFALIVVTAVLLRLFAGQLILLLA